MAVRIELNYLGDLQCEAIHGPSGERLHTDAPPDNQGKGRSFSPTDLLATSIGACMLTVIGIAARARGWDLAGASASVDKEMGSTPRRRVARLGIVVRLPATLDEHARTVLERSALTCPAKASLGPDTQVDVRFEYH